MIVRLKIGCTAAIFQGGTGAQPPLLRSDARATARSQPRRPRSGPCGRALPSPHGERCLPCAVGRDHPPSRAARRPPPQSGAALRGAGGPRRGTRHAARRRPGTRLPGARSAHRPAVGAGARRTREHSARRADRPGARRDARAGRDRGADAPAGIRQPDPGSRSAAAAPGEGQAEARDARFDGRRWQGSGAAAPRRGQTRATRPSAGDRGVRRGARRREGSVHPAVDGERRRLGGAPRRRGLRGPQDPPVAVGQVLERPVPAA